LNRHTVALIMAAGRGDRFEGVAPKQLALVSGRPMVAWSIERFAACTGVDEIYLVIPPGQTDAWRAAMAEPSGEHVSVVVEGGERRQDSVRLGVEALPETATHVLVHDAARPCLSLALLDRMVAALNKHGAVVPAVPAVDTLVVSTGDAVDAIVNRTNIAGVQTPQAFETQLLLRAHRKAFADGLKSSDDGSLVLALGERVATVAGDHTNIKITYPEDVAIAEAILTQMK
jgi:2-C-methyl-D-erythritol 4-phosphate cytidylyltransferase